MLLTLADLEYLKKQGKIRAFTTPVKAPKSRKALPKACPYKAKMQAELDLFARHHKILLRQEHHFHPERQWRFDWAFPDLKVAIEYEGIFSDKSRHTTATGFSKDTEKYNAAAILGWRVLRYTAKTHHRLITELNSIKPHATCNLS